MAKRRNRGRTPRRMDGRAVKAAKRLESGSSVSRTGEDIVVTLAVDTILAPPKVGPPGGATKMLRLIHPSGWTSRNACLPLGTELCASASDSPQVSSSPPGSTSSWSANENHLAGRKATHERRAYLRKQEKQECGQQYTGRLTTA